MRWFAVLMLLLLPGLSLAQEADFSGSWRLDEQLSLSMESLLELQGVPWALRKMAGGFDVEALITQSADGMTVTFDNLRGLQRQELVFDGQPHQTVNPAGLPTTLSSTWAEGGVLVATGPVEAEGRTATLTERRALSRRGDVMTVQVQLTLPDGQSASTRRVYRKQ